MFVDVVLHTFCSLNLINILKFTKKLKIGDERVALRIDQTILFFITNNFRCACYMYPTSQTMIPYVKMCERACVRA